MEKDEGISGRGRNECQSVLAVHLQPHYTVSLCPLPCSGLSDQPVPFAVQL